MVTAGCFKSQEIGSTPSLAYLCEHITPVYAADWKVIGTLLGIPKEELNIIEGSYPTNLKCCCNRMLEKWLEMDTTASLEKLFAAIHSPAVSGINENDGNCSTQLLGDLYKHITPVHAAKWKMIGTLLGIPNADLRIIEGGYPTNLKWCCNKMLEKWLEIDPTASWEKIFVVIDSPAVSSTSFDNVPDGYRPSPEPCGCKVTGSNSLHCNEQLESIRLYYSFYVANDVHNCLTVDQSLCFKDSTINLHGNKLEEDLEYVAVFIISSTKKYWIEVNLSNCGINDHCIHLLYLRLHKDNDVTIKVLQLNNNRITGLYSSWISDIAVDYEIQKLLVNGNQGIGQSEQFYCMLTNPNTNLRVLHMQNVKLSDKDARYLFTALQCNNTLKELNVTDNGITDLSCAIITTTLRRNNCLAKLWMWKNPISGEASKLILKDIKHNSSLEQLGLRYYSESIQKSITVLQDGINMIREGRKGLVKLQVHFT